MVSFKKAKSWNGVQGVFLQREASCSTNRETSPTELLPRKQHPTSQRQVATALNPVWEHLCFTRARSFYASTSRMCPQVPLLWFMLFWLMKGFLGVLCFQAVGKPGLGTGGAAICPLHPPHPPQSGHHVIFRHFVNYPAIHLYVHFPRVHNHDFT